jgi:hypothetical protein
MTQESPYRGIQSIREAKARMIRLIAWYSKHKPEITELCVSRADYDLIARWPRAADVEGFVVNHNGIFYEGMRLKYDAVIGRYDKGDAHKQVVIS